MPHRRRPRLRLGVFIVSALLTLSLVALWVDSYRVNTSLSYSLGVGEPMQAAALPGDLQGMWHDRVSTLSLVDQRGVLSLSHSRARFAFYDQPTPAELFRGIHLARTPNPTWNVVTPTATIYVAPGQWSLSDSIWQRLGFAYTHTIGPTLERRAVSAPFLPLVVLAGVPGVLVARGWRRQRRRQRLGSCLSCGYSRAGLTHDALCPECSVPPAPSPPERLYPPNTV